MKYVSGYMWKWKELLDTTIREHNGVFGSKVEWSPEGLCIIFCFITLLLLWVIRCVVQCGFTRKRTHIDYYSSCSYNFLSPVSPHLLRSLRFKFSKSRKLSHLWLGGKTHILVFFINTQSYGVKLELQKQSVLLPKLPFIIHSSGFIFN